MTEESPTIHYAAAVGPDGAVYRGPECSKSEAIAWRKLGKDIVVCGESPLQNDRLAREIELAVAGPSGVKRDKAHTYFAGPAALPHYQPGVRPPYGHTFFETQLRKSCR